MKRFSGILLTLSLSLFLVSGCVSQSEYNSHSDENNESIESIEKYQPLSPASDNSDSSDSSDNADDNSSEQSITSSDYSSNTPQTQLSPSTADNNDYSFSHIVASMGLGWNLGNQFEASIGGTPGETAWGNPPVTEKLIQLVKSQGFSTVRIPVSYLNKIGAAPDYKIDEQWLNRIQQVVDYVIANDMFAVINIHGDGYYTVDGGWLLCAEENQSAITEKYACVWRQIAERFKDYDERLVFESMNEVFNNTYGAPPQNCYSNINAYNRIFTETVRKTGGKNAERWLLIAGWNTDITYTAGDYGFEIPEDNYCIAPEKRLMISVHYYDPYNFTLDESPSTATTQWGKSALYNFDSWGQEDYADKQLAVLYERFVKNGYPVVVGEMGVSDKSHLDDEFNYFRQYWYEYITAACIKNGCVPVYWDNGRNGENGFALFDRNSLNVTQPEIINAVMSVKDSG